MKRVKERKTERRKERKGNPTNGDLDGVYLYLR